MKKCSEFYTFVYLLDFYVKYLPHEKSPYCSGRVFVPE